LFYRLSVVAAALMLGAAPARGQTVQGRVVELPGEEPIPGALMALVDTAGREVTRSATSPSGGFTLGTRVAGRYHVLIRQIGQQPWRSPVFALAAGATYPVTFQVDARPYELPALTVEAKRSRCGVRPGEEGVVGGLLEAAQVALQLAKATSDAGRLAFSTASYLKQLTRPAGPRQHSRGRDSARELADRERASRQSQGVGLRPAATGA